VQAWNSPRPMTSAANSNRLCGPGLMLVCVLLAACTTPSGVDRAGDGSVTTAQGRASPPTDTVAERAKAIEAYRGHLLRYPDSTQYDAIRRRLADLLVEQAADLELTATAEEESQRARARYAEAIPHYEYLVQRESEGRERIQLLYQLVRAYQGSGDIEQALKTIEQLLASNPQSDPRLYADMRFRQGELYFTQGNFSGAEPSYRAVVALGTEAPAFRQSLYKLGWSLFRQERYSEALPPLLQFLYGDAPPASGLESPSEVEREQTEEVYGVISSSLARLGGIEAVNQYVRQGAWSGHADQICLKLAQWYVDRGQVIAAAETWIYLARLHPDSIESPRLLLQSVALYREYGFAQLARDTETELVRSYGMDSRFWESNSAADLPDVSQGVARSLADLADQANRRARNSGDPQAAKSAEQWYLDYLAWFGAGPEAPRVNFQLAQLLFADGRYEESFNAFEHTAWDLGDHPYAPEAALGAQRAWQRLTEEPDSRYPPGLQDRALSGALRFVTSWPDHPGASVLLASWGVALLAQQRYQDSLSASEQSLARSSSTTPELRQVAWSLRGQSLYAMGDYRGAASSYREALGLADSQDPRRDALREGLAQSNYHRAGEVLAQGDLRAATLLYARAAELAPGTPVGSKSTYDAATVLLAHDAWAEAIQGYLRFRTGYPDDPLQPEVTRKLAYAYERNGEPAQAAAEYMQLAREHHMAGELAREALLQAADLYQQAGHLESANAARENYVDRFPEPAGIAIQQMVRLAEYQRDNGNDRRRVHWLETIVSRDRAAGDMSTRAAAARAALELARYRLLPFRQVRLIEPVQKNLALKIDAMDQALQAFESAAGYGVPSVTAAANFYVANIYEELGDALISSERPAALTMEELAEYNQMLTEQARPFKQQAIEMYSANTINITDEKAELWTRKSAERLRELQDGS